MKKALHSIIFFTTLITILSNCASSNEKPEPMQKGTEFYLGTYTNSDSKGIYKYTLLEDGKLELVGLVAQSENPSFLTKSPDGKYLLAVNENTEGSVESFKIEKDSLVFINRSASGGAHPCHIMTTENGHVLAANYTGGNVGLLELMEDGKLSALLDVQQHSGKGTHTRQDAPHAHSAWLAPDNETIISVDLGTNELIFSKIDSENKKLIPDSTQHKLQMNPEAGPRHLSIHPNKKWIYVIDELTSSVSLVIKEEGLYTVKSSISTLPEDYAEGNTCADIHISDDGKFLYASNRGHNSIAIFSIGENGELSALGHESTKGDGPRNFSLSPNNEFLLVANQNTNNIISFKRNIETGALDFVSEINAPVPVCILF